MKRLNSVFPVLVSLLFASPAVADWEIIASGTSVDLHAFRYVFTTWLVGDEGTLLESPDNGLNWSGQPSGTLSDLHESHMPSSSNWWLAGSGGTVLVSTDQGTTWDPRGVGDASANLRTIFSRSSGIAFAAGDDGKVFYSNNVGNTWYNRHIGVPVDLYTGISPTIGGQTAIVAGQSGLMYSTANAGSSWSPVTTGTFEDIHDIIGGPGSSLIAFGGGGTVLRSEDLGVTWARMPSSVTADLYGASTSGATSNIIVACGAGGTLIKSTDGGTTWGRLESPTEADLYDVFGYNNSVWVACGAGGMIIRTTDGGGVVAVGDTPAAVPGAELLPAYPNPFNPRTNLQYRLEAPGAIQLAVYAVDGHLIRTLVNGRRDAGWHVVHWDGRDSAGMAMASGVYLARLTAGDQVVARRMQLVK